MNKSTKIIGILFGIFLLVLIPIVDKNTYHHIVLCQTLVNIVVVTGLNFITGLTGQMNMGTAGIMALGAYSAALCSAKFHMPVVVGFIVAIVMGILIGKGYTMDEAMKEVQMVVEGVYSAKAGLLLAQKYGCDMPIVSQVNQVLFDGKSPKEALADLMMRDPRIESSDLPWEG